MNTEVIRTGRDRTQLRFLVLVFTFPAALGFGMLAIALEWWVMFAVCGAVIFVCELLLWRRPEVSERSTTFGSCSGDGDGAQPTESYLAAAGLPRWVGWIRYALVLVPLAAACVCSWMRGT